MTDAIDRLVADANKKGLLVCDVTQTAPDEWRASLRYKNTFTYATGEGSTMIDAMTIAYNNAQRKQAQDDEFEEQKKAPKKTPRVRSAREE